jgi:hypothetical protein
MSITKNLQSAGKAYSECAKKVTTKCSNPKQPTVTESELRIALGIASDWTRRAAAMQPITYNSRLMNRSPKTHSVSEMIRFNLAWSGMNALFSRNSIALLFGPIPPNSELERFRLLYANSGVLSAAITGRLINLHNILATPTLSVIPGNPTGTSLPIIQVLHEKYTPIHYQKMATGRLIASAVKTGNYSALDMPLLIYLMRNWSVHGGLLGSSFRSVPRFDLYINTVSDVLSEIHLGLSAELLRRV